MTDNEYRPSKRSFRLAKSSIGILIVAVLVTAVSGWLAYLSSRRAVLDSVALESLTVAQSIVNDLEYDLEHQAGFRENRQVALEHVEEIWARQELSYVGSYLCVIESPGRLALHTANPAMHGTDVSQVVATPNDEHPKTVRELLQSKGSVATQNRNFRGKTQLAGYAYMPTLDSLVVVHVPLKLVEGQIRKTALPWALALALMATMLIPLSIFLSHLGNLSADRAARSSWQEGRRSEHRFRAIFDSTFQFIGLTSTDGILLEVNEAALKFGGFRREEVIGKPFWEAPWWRGNAQRVEQLKDAVKRASAGEFVRYTVDVQGEKSKEIIDFTLKPVLDDDGKVELLVPEGRVVTEQKMAEMNLAESEARLRAVIDSEPECVTLVGARGELLNMNPAGLAMIEADSLEQVVNQPVYPVIASEYRKTFQAMHNRVMSGASAQLEFEIVGLRGARRWMETHASPLRDASGRIIAHLAITRDISDKKQIRQQLQFTQFSVDSCSCPIFWIRDDASFFYVNEAATQQFGYSREELLELSVHDIDPAIPPETWPEYWDDLQRRRSSTVESEIKCKDGALVPIEVTINLLDYEGQQYVFAFVMVITERKAAEELVRANEARFRALVENSYDVIGLFSTTGRLIYASPAIQRVLGFDPTEILNVRPESLLHPDDSEKVFPVIGQLIKKRDSVIHGIYRLQHKNGSYRTIELTATNLVDEPGVNAFVAIFRDISDRWLAEERLRERESQLTHVARISTMGEIAAGIAHEIKQPLHAVANFAMATAVALQSDPCVDILNKELSDDLIEWNEGIKTAAVRASEIVQRLRSYARKSERRFELVDIDSLFKEAIDLIAFEIRRNKVVLETDLARDFPEVDCDRIQIHQVLVNLLQNANEALKTSPQENRQVRLSALRDGERIQIQVSDNGPGIGQDFHGKVFEAFFTTKPNGIGLGLAISRTIVENHGGNLSVARNEQGGATFTFTLPVDTTQKKVSKQESVDAI